MDSISKYFPIFTAMRLHKEGFKIIITLLLALVGINVAVQLFYTGNVYITNSILGASIIILLLIVQFFRLPNRTIVSDENKIFCPADGKVVVIEEVEETEYFKEKRIQVSVFMSPVNVHVNWHPISGQVKYNKYHPGKYLVAWHPKSSTENERTTVVVEGNKGAILIRQIAGAVARRIVTYTKENDQVKQGEELGFIKFGSRVDLFLPLGTKINVELNEKVKGNRTVLAEFG